MEVNRGATAPRTRMRWTRWIACLIAWAAPMVSLGAELDCRRAGIVVTGAAEHDLQSACAAAGDALTWLEPTGWTLEHGPAIQLVEQMTPSSPVHVLGHYDARRHVIELLDDAAAVAASGRAQRAFKLPMSRALWQSYVAHEVTHAILHAQDRTRTLTVAQHEYVAAVVQLGTLPEAHRAEILAEYAEFPAFGNPSEISDVYYYLAPGAFAVKAYRHYLQPGNGSASISRFLSAGPRQP